MKNRFQSLLAVAITIGLFSFTMHSTLPDGWLRAGSNPSDYEMEIDKKVYKVGKQSACIKSNKKNIDGFGTLMHMAKADNYLGKKIKMTAFVKSENVADWAGLWLRVDGEKRSETLSFDNMQDRPIKGTSNWARYSITLDVPKEATTINYGDLVSGTGTLWFDGLKIEIVGDADGKDNKYKSKVHSEPMNLDFEE